MSPVCFTTPTPDLNTPKGNQTILLEKIKLYIQTSDFCWKFSVVEGKLLSYLLKSAHYG